MAVMVGGGGTVSVAVEVGVWQCEIVPPERSLFAFLPLTTAPVCSPCAVGAVRCMCGRVACVGALHVWARLWLWLHFTRQLFDREIEWAYQQVRGRPLGLIVRRGPPATLFVRKVLHLHLLLARLVCVVLLRRLSHCMTSS